MNFLQQGILTLLARAQFARPLFSRSGLSYEIENVLDSERKHRCRSERNRGRENLNSGGEDIHRYPNCDCFDKVCAATTKNEEPECQKHPVIRNVPPPLVAEIPERNGDCEV